VNDTIANGWTRDDDLLVDDAVTARRSVLAVPNVSEGRDPATIAALVDACRVPGVRVLDVHSDPDHHRSVITLVGNPMAVQDALVELAGECVDRIDLRRHRGVHPRIGALDVAPLVALEPDEMGLASEVAEGLAGRLGRELNLPVFLYGTLASDSERIWPRDFRRGGLDALEAAIDDGSLIPDEGPRRLHPSAGAVLVGARGPLIAWNMWLPDGSISEARAIADRVRESSGGLPGVRALGFYLPEHGMAQVSMNLEDYRRTPPQAIVAAVRREADRLGVEVGDSELVGLIPAQAFGGATPGSLGLPRFRPGQLLDAQAPELVRHHTRH
jgi:glutamate formiminotransferase